MRSRACEQACSPFRHCTFLLDSGPFSKTVLIHHFVWALTLTLTQPHYWRRKLIVRARFRQETFKNLERFHEFAYHGVKLLSTQHSLGNFVEMCSLHNKLPSACGTCRLSTIYYPNCPCVFKSHSRLFMILQVGLPKKCLLRTRRTSLAGNLAHPALLKSPRHSRTFFCVWWQDIDKDHEKQGVWAGLFSIPLLRVSFQLDS